MKSVILPTSCAIQHILRSGIPVTIIDENRYFADGLLAYLDQHTRCNTAGNTRAMLFFTFRTFWDLQPELLSFPSSTALICIADPQQTEEDFFRLYPWIPILFRNSGPDTLMAVVEKALVPDLHQISRRREAFCPLTQKETEVISRLASGLSVTEVGKHFGLGEKTVSFYKRRTMNKLGFRTFHALCDWLNRARIR
nr:LuxR C-terminal-related transcriptional regulator [Pantoea sp. 201603H]